MICQNESFKKFPSLFLCKIGCTRAEPKYDPKEIILTTLMKSHHMMLHAKYERFCPYGLSEKDFKRIPSLILCKIVCARAELKYEHQWHNFKNFHKGLLDDTTCKIRIL